MSSELKKQITDSVKAAMRAKEKERLVLLRNITSEIKRIEVDERIDIDDTRILAILDKMTKQRRDSAQQFSDAGRDELAANENAEISVIQEFLPSQLSEDEISQAVSSAIAETGATGMADMGKLMAALKPKVQGRADMGAVSKLVKAALN